MAGNFVAFTTHQSVCANVCAFQENKKTPPTTWKSFN